MCVSLRNLLFLADRKRRGAVPRFADFNSFYHFKQTVVKIIIVNICHFKKLIVQNFPPPPPWLAPEDEVWVLLPPPERVSCGRAVLVTFW